MVDTIINDTRYRNLLLKLKDYSSETWEHSVRIAKNAELLYPYTGFNNDIRTDIIAGALLHDIGKLDIPKHILEKKGALDSWEREIINKHPIYGINYLNGCSNITRDICLYHHKKSDGSGYPSGNLYKLEGYVKFITVLDIFDALSHARSYKKILPDINVIQELRQEASDGLIESKFTNLLNMIPFADSLLN